jgi:hypothetical protein
MQSLPRVEKGWEIAMSAMADDNRASRGPRGVALTLAALGLVAGGLIALDRAVAGGGFNPRDGKYEGKTAQNQDVKFTVDGKRVEKPKYTVQKGPCTATLTIIGGDKVNDRGKFSIPAGNNEFNGKFVTKRRVEGHATLDFSQFTSCTGTKTVSYDARR